MSVQVSPEANVRVVAEKGNPTVRNAETARSAEAYRNTVKEEGAKRAMEQMALRKERVDGASASKNISENIGSAATDPVTGVKARNPDEQKRFDRATRAEDRLLKFLHEGKGYVNLNVTEQRAMRNALSTEIRQWPGGDDLFTGKTPAEIDMFLEQWAKDPTLFDKVKELHAKRVVNSEEKTGRTTQEHTEKIEETEKTIETKEKEITTNQDEQKKEYEIIESFEDRTATGGKLGDNKARLDIIGGEISLNYQPAMIQALKREQAEWDTEVKFLIDAITAENGAKKPDPAELSRLRGLLNTARTELRTKNGKLENYKNLTQEKADLEVKRDASKQKYEQLTDEHIQKTNELTNLQKESFVVKAEMGMLSGDRADLEEVFVKSIEGIYGDALSELWGERMKLLEKCLDEKDQEELTNPDADPMRKAFLEGVGMLGYKAEVKGGKFRGARTLERKLDKDKIGAYFDGIKNRTTTPGDIVREVLLGVKKADGTNYTNAEIADWISAHPELAKKSEEDSMERLVIAGLQARKINQKDIDAFANVGFINEDKLINKLENDPEVKKKLEQAGITQKAWQEIKKHKKIGLGLLTILLLGPAGATLVGGYTGVQLLRGGAKKEEHA